MLKPVFYDEKLKDKILFRQKINTDEVEKSVKDILETVKTQGDAALKEYTLKFDGVNVDDLKVTTGEITEAFSLVGEDFICVIKRSLENIKKFHEKQVRKGFEISDGDKIIGQKVCAVSVAGIYVPGGTAAYPSTVLMNAVPAKTAGVKKVVMVTPPQKNGKIKPEVLVAASLSGVDEIYKVGGAQAIAALAYGTQSIPKADVVTGPGNVYVATAKKFVYGEVGIDMIAGPSEILVIADDTAKPNYVAADMLSQAEHDKLATAVLLTDSESLANEVAKEIDRQLELLPRKEIAKISIENNGKIIITKNIDDAIKVSDLLAPEHLELCVKNPFDALKKVNNAGSVFLGNSTPEAVGDYYAGSNHTLPTSGTARFSSPLGVETFLKTTQYVYYSENALKAGSGDIANFAEREGLSAHAKSVTIRNGL